jgi:hypothetical protein
MVKIIPGFSLSDLFQDSLTSRIHLQPGENLLWSGQPSYPKKYGIVAIIFSILLIIVSRFPQSTGAITLIPSVIIVFIVWIFLKFAGTQYFVTNYRIAKSRNFLGYKKWDEVPLTQLSNVSTRTSRGKGYVTFMMNSNSKMSFYLLKDNPDIVKSFVLSAKTNISSE